MMRMLFDKNFFIGVFTVVILVVLIWLCVKYPSFRLACFTLITVGMGALTAYCVVNLNVYYNASGGIYGEITGLFSPSATVEETSIKFDNLELIQYLDTDTYYCKIITDKVIEIDNKKNYLVFVNDTPCSNAEVAPTYISCDYRYQFFNENNRLLCDDTLKIRLVFNKNNSYFYISTDNGTNSVKYWNYYINKNDFIVSIKEIGYSKDDKLRVVKGEADYVYRVDYVYTDNFTQTKFYHQGEKLELINLPAVENWTCNDVVVTNNSRVNEDMVVQANFYDYDRYLYECLVCELECGAIIGGNTNQIGLVYYDFEEQEYSVISLYGYGWSGYSTMANDKAAILSSTYSEIDDVIFFEEMRQIQRLDGNMERIYPFYDGLTLKMLYTLPDTEGVYLYDASTNTRKMIYDKDYWTSFTGRWNEFTGMGSTIVIKGSPSTYYLQYDFVYDSLRVCQYPKDDDLVVGF